MHDAAVAAAVGLTAMRPTCVEIRGHPRNRKYITYCNVTLMLRYHDNVERVVFEISERTDTETDRQTDTLITILRSLPGTEL